MKTIAALPPLLSPLLMLVIAPAPRAAVAEGAAAAAPMCDHAGLTLPAGFCASVFADRLGHARHLAVAEDGVVYVNTWDSDYYTGAVHPGGFLIALKDSKGAGIADSVQRFGPTHESGAHGGTGIAVFDGYLYAEIDDRIVRYKLPASGSVPRRVPEIIVSGLPLGGDHPMHPFVIDSDGQMYIDVGTATNSCQPENRTRRSPGIQPCVELETRGGIWRYEARRTGQVFSKAGRYATGIRNAVGVALDPDGHDVYVSQHGRDQLRNNWPEFYKAEEEATQPAEELLRLQPGGDYGWPECYFDVVQRKLVLAPEYGGDGGRSVGVCAEKLPPVAYFPAHWAPDALLMYRAQQFPARYRQGIFIAFHGSWDRAPFPQGGYNIVFQPLSDGKATGGCEIFADDFAGPRVDPQHAQQRPAGLALGPDGAMYIGDDVHGRIYRITYKPGADAGSGSGEGAPVGARPCPAADAPAGAIAGIAGTPPEASVNSPVPPGATAAMVALGARVFRGEVSGAGCTGCHGTDGGGSPLGPTLGPTSGCGVMAATPASGRRLRRGFRRPGSSAVPCPRWVAPSSRTTRWRPSRLTSGPSATARHSSCCTAASAELWAGPRECGCPPVTIANGTVPVYGSYGNCSSMDLARLYALFSPPSDPNLLATGHYDFRLVALSVLVAIFASWMALRLASHSDQKSTTALRAVALITGTLSLGAGVWAMHFIGMLAFSVCAVTYDPAITLWSMLPSIGASALALHLIGGREIRPWQLIGGGVAVGAGIGAMHYTGMAAMQMAPILRYDPVIFGVSIIVAVSLAILALWVRFRLQKMMISAVVMGLAISGMHYTGMAAARFVGHVPAGTTTNAALLALIISAITIAFTLVVTIINGALRQREMFHRLQDRDARMRALFATAADGVVIFDAAGLIADCNTSAEKIFARARTQIVGHDLNTLISGSVGLRTGEALAVRPDGSTLPIRLSIGQKQAQHDLYVGFLTDVSERRAMEQALRASERQLRSLIGNIPGISYRCRMEDDFPAVFVSDAVERLTGYPPADFVGPNSKRRIIDLVHPDDREALKNTVEAAIRESKPYVLEYRIKHRDGRERYMWGSGCAVRDSQGEFKYLDGVILDLSERRQMEQELRAAKDRAEQAAAARAAFLANMSHEIRTPMNSIIGFSDVLLQSDMTSDQRRHLLTVSGAARSLLRLLNEILDTAKLDKGLVELELRDFNLQQLVDEVSSTLAASARARGLALHIRYENTLPQRFHGDALRIRQVLTNLMSNAVKFTNHGSVTLAVADSNDQVHLTVRDTGIGIAADRLEAIFDPFTQADPSMSRRYGGTGLGTTISKQLVELMGGTIWVESTLGEGSCFHVLLPLPAAPDSLEQTQRNRRIAALPPLRILAADDAPQNLELLTLLLGGHGHTVVPAHTGLEAVQLAAEQRFDLVLMDVQMPDMDGHAATRAIRAREAERAAPRVPVIALSASVLSDDRRAAMDAGMDAFVSKPVDLVELSLQMARVLGYAENIERVPHRPGIRPQLLNVEQALSRWGGQREPYLRALQHFVAEYTKLPTLLSNYGVFGGGSEACSLAHRVKGVAGNLGLEKLAQLLDEIERNVVNDAADALRPLLPRLRHLIYDSFAAIDLELAKSPSVGAGPRPVQPIDVALIRSLGDQLSARFRRGELDGAAFAQLLDALTGNIEAARLDELQRLVDDFDFMAADALTGQICAEFEMPLAAVLA